MINRDDVVQARLKTILLVEDSPDDVELFTRIVRRAGVENPVHVVSDGDEAIAYLNGDGIFSDRDEYPAPCAVFLDLKMPRTDGWDVLNWIHTSGDLIGMLVMVLTALDDSKEITRAHALGAHSFFVKPLKELDLKDLAHYFRMPQAEKIIFVRERRFFEKRAFKFLDANGRWVVLFDDAAKFNNVRQAVEFCFKKDVHDAEIVLRAGDPIYEIMIDVR